MKQSDLTPPYNPDRDMDLMVFAFGRAMAMWARLESDLGMLFYAVTGLEKRMSTEIFGSSRSFSGKTDMFRAALKTSTRPEYEKDVCAVIISKLQSWSSFRNQLAHGEISIFEDEDGDSRIGVIKSRQNPSSDIYDGVGISEIDCATRNYLRLCLYVNSTYRNMQKPNAKSERRLQLYRSRVLRLPAAANSVKPAQIQAGQRRPRPMPQA